MADGFFYFFERFLLGKSLFIFEVGLGRGRQWFICRQVVLDMVVGVSLSQKVSAFSQFRLLGEDSIWGWGVFILYKSFCFIFILFRGSSVIYYFFDRVIEVRVQAYVQGFRRLKWSQDLSLGQSDFKVIYVVVYLYFLFIRGQVFFRSFRFMRKSRTWI